ncbi:MAG: glycerol-3-phosphate 1-O-acyltransferase PlsY [Victivallaceae bacterium]|nr:glycerol-3-phosphate 1-O-acyltransferase PlsY [Victivallaceae bacterium]
MTYIFVFIGAYLFGATPWGFIIGKMRGIDIREHGSGNIGATNITRTLGSIPGKICFVLDLLKGLIPVLATMLLVKHQIIIIANIDYAMIIATLATVIGHMFPVYLKFKGGKGISTTGGALLALAPGAFICSALLWVIVFKTSRYVSLASIIAAATLPLNAWIMNIAGLSKTTVPLMIFLAILGLLAIIRHTSNIKRLLNGTESRFAKK